MTIFLVRFAKFIDVEVYGMLFYVLHSICKKFRKKTLECTKKLKNSQPEREEMKCDDSVR
jgi:hypothetical protein